MKLAMVQVYTHFEVFFKCEVGHTSAVLKGSVGAQCAKKICTCLGWVVNVLTLGVVVHQLFDL